MAHDRAVRRKLTIIAPIAIAAALALAAWVLVSPLHTPKRPLALPRRFADAARVSTGVIMEPSEAQARASIAAALIVRGVVEVPSIPLPGDLSDSAGMRLRELTDYVYRLVTMQIPEP